MLDMAYKGNVDSAVQYLTKVAVPIVRFVKSMSNYTSFFK